MRAVLPLYYWPPLPWLQAATHLQSFCVGYPPAIPRASLFYRCYLPAHGWLSIPLQRSLRKDPWKTTWPPNNPWQRYHFKVLQTLYGKAPFFLEWKPLLEEIYLTPVCATLAQVAWRIIQEMSLWYGWKVRLQHEPQPFYPLNLPSPPPSGVDYLLRFGLPPGSL